MSKEEAVNYFINTIYSNDTKLILSEKDIKDLNSYYKKIIEIDNNLDSLFEDDITKLNRFSNIIEHVFDVDSIEVQKKLIKLKSGMYEVKKQFNNNKALQAGILSECNYMETLARIFKLNKCLDCDNTPISKVPLECRSFLNNGFQTFSSARYIYYNPKKLDVFIFQYGNPADGDAEIIINGNKIRLEFKERNAKTGEYDITGLYNEEGKLQISDKFKEQSSEVIPLINKFNSETSVISILGHNYSDFDEYTKKQCIIEYFNKHNVDVLISSTKSSELIALTKDVIENVLNNGNEIISTDNSEIRTSGRNSHKVFTEKLFNNTLCLLNAQKIDGEKYKVSLDNPLIEIKKGRGTNTDSRIRFNYVFYVKITDVEIIDKYIIFKLKDVKQLVPTISMHIKINATKEQLKEYYKINEVNNQ